MKKRTILFSMLLGMTLMFNACSNNSSNTNTTTPSNNNATNSESSKEPEISAEEPAWKSDSRDVKLSWYVNADWWNTAYGEDTITRKMKEDLKLDVEFIAGNDDVLNSMMASGQVADIITIFSDSPLGKDANKWATPLNTLAEKYDPYFFKVADKEVLDWYKLPDNNTYGFPSFYNTTADYESGYLFSGNGFIVRSDIYEAIGKPDMSTPEGFMKALDDAHAAFPDVVTFGSNDFGKDLGSWGGSLFELLAVPVEKDGKLYSKTDDQDYQTWISVLNDAYLKGYIPDDTFSDDSQIVGEKIAQGKYFAMIATSVTHNQVHFAKNMTEHPERKYIPIDGPASSDKRKPEFVQSGLNGWSVTYISKTCKDPQKAIEMFTYLISDEGRILATFGVEGETFTYNADGKAVILPEIAKMQVEDPDKFFKDYRLTDFWFFMTDVSRYKYGIVEENPAVVDMYNYTKPYLTPQFAVVQTDPDSGTKEARDNTNIKLNRATTILSMVRAKTKDEFSKLYEDHVKFREANGYDAVMNAINAKYENNKERLGLK